jgi:archaellum component FlaC
VSDLLTPDERFDRIESVLTQLANSQRQLLQAQVIMNDRLSKTEIFVEKLAEQAVGTNERIERLAENVESLAEQVTLLAGNVENLTDGQKHTDQRIDALADIVRQWIERNGKAGH